MSNAKNIEVEIVCTFHAATPARIVPCRARFAEDCDCHGQHDEPAVGPRFSVHMSVDGGPRHWITTVGDRSVARGEAVDLKGYMTRKGYTVKVTRVDA